MKISKKDKELLGCFTDTPSDLVFWSFRYFLGRMTIHACCFAESLAKAWPHLDERVQNLIIRELEEEFKRDDEARLRRTESTVAKQYISTLPLGMDCDRAAWQKVRDAYTKL